MFVLISKGGFTRRQHFLKLAQSAKLDQYKDARPCREDVDDRKPGYCIAGPQPIMKSMQGCLEPMWSFRELWEVADTGLHLVDHIQLVF
jgi:hypothetical protein